MLKSLNLNKDSIILFPDYICNVVLSPLKLLGIKYEFYEINYKLEPVWSSIIKKYSNNVKGIFLLHYFGQPQNVDRFIKFCSDRQILLFEDNAHGFGSLYKGNMLGRFGDIGFSSPWKTFPIYNGSYLYTNNYYSKPSYAQQPLNIFSRHFEDIIINLWNQLESKNLIHKNLNFNLENYPKYIDEPLLPKWGMDQVSDDYLKSVNFRKVRDKRQKIYFLWNDFCLSKGLTPVFEKLDSLSVPSVFPAFSNSFDEGIKFIKWGISKGIDIHKWPNLPYEIINNRSNATKIWRKLICFPIHLNMDENKLYSLINK